jgi:hypothetical protein
VSTVARSLDDLDRLAFRLSRTIRTQHPQLLALGFTLSDLEERLLPFREVRREMANGGADAFESALLRLVAGERNYVMADPALQRACRQALAFPSPTLSMVRAWATSTLQLNQPARAATGSGAGAGAEAPVVRRSGSGAVRAHPAYDPADDLFPAPGEGTAVAGRAQLAGTVGHHTTERATYADSHCCRFCDNTLPQGRAVTYCPYCGMDLTKRHCAACSTELDVHWRYCVTCGRQG